HVTGVQTSALPICAHQEQVVAERRGQVGDLAGDGVEHAVPHQVEAQGAHQRDVQGGDDHQHGGVVQEHAHDDERQLHEDEDLPGAQVQAIDEQRLDGI